MVKSVELTMKWQEKEKVDSINSTIIVFSFETFARSIKYVTRGVDMANVIQ